MSNEFLIISTSLNPESRSRLLARSAYEQIAQENSAKWIDLRDINLPICDGGAAYEAPDLAGLTAQVKEAKCILLGIPIYNYAASASAKNLIELTGRAWTEKVVGFLCAAGGRASYMSVMNLGNSLMLDFRCVIIPRFVYAYSSVFGEDELFDDSVKNRITELCTAAVKFSKLA
jgi:FMN reductase